MMKRIFVIINVMLLMMLTATACAEGIDHVEISFDYLRASTHASNQYAVWIEDAEGKLVKTLYVTRFTAGRRGYRSRDMALPDWVAAANPEQMTDEALDAVSGATLSQGRLVFEWDMRDAEGKRVPKGNYYVKVEGSLYWESYVLFTAEVDTVQIASGAIEVEVYRSEPENKDNEDMIEDVQVVVVCIE